MKFLIIVLFSTFAGITCDVFASGENQVNLARNGKPLAIVVIADHPSLTASYAAEEFVAHIELAAGTKLELFKESELPKADSSRIFIGDTAASRRLGIDTAALKPDEFVLRISHGDLYVVGKETPDANPTDEHNNHRGTLFGVYETLERFVGVRWLWPSTLGTFVPRTDNLVIADPLDEQQQPRLRFRAFHWNQVKMAARKYSKKTERLAFTEAGIKNYHRDLLVYLSRHRLGFTEKKPSTRHEFSYWWKKHGQEHPEWFMLNENGKRGPKEDANPWQLSHVPMCVSNPELHRYIVDKHWDGGDDLRLGEVDVRAFCQCEKCLAWDGPQPENPPDFAKVDYTPRLVSDRYARFWKTIYDMAVKRNPNVKVTTFLYWNYMPAPLGNIELHPGIYGEFVPWSGRTAYFPMRKEEEQWLREQWLGWERKNISIAYRPNYFHGGYVMPHLSTWQAGEFLRFAYKHGMVGTSFDSLFGHWAAKGPMLYMHMRLFWNPELEIAAIRQEYFSAFGPAAVQVERYFDYWEDYSQDCFGGRMYNPVSAHLCYPEKVFLPADKLLQDALEAAQTSPLPEFAARVEFLRAGLEHAKLAAKFTSFLDYGPLGEFGSVHGVKYEPVPVKNRQRFEQCRQALRELVAFRKAHEHQYIADYIDAAARENRRIDIDTLLKDDPQ